MTSAVRSAARSKTVRSIARTVVFNFANTLAAGVGGIILARELGAAGRGEYATSVAWLGLALVVGELGQTAAVVYQSSRYPHRSAAVVATSAAIMRVTGLVAMVIVLAIALSAQLESSRATSLFVISLILPISFLTSPFVFVLQSRDIGVWNWVRSSQPLLWLLLLCALAPFIQLQVWTALVLMLVSIAAQGVLAWNLCRRRGFTGERVDKSLGGPLLIYGAKHLLAVLPTSLMRQLDVILLVALGVAAQAVGHYSVAISFALIATPLASAIGAVLFPAQARAEATEQQKVGTYLAWTAVAVVAACLPLVGLAWLLIPFMYGPEFDESVSLAYAVAPALLGVALNQVGGDLLRGQGRPGLVAKSSWSGLAALVVAMLVLVPRWGTLGACVAFCVGQWVAALIMLGFLRMEKWGSLRSGRTIGDEGNDEA